MPPPLPTTAALLAMAATSFALVPQARAQQQPPAPAQEREDDYSQYYTGAFYELGARALASTAGDSDFGGLGFDVGLRGSFPMYLGDLRLAYRFDALDAEAPTQHPGQIDQHSVGLTLNVHPLFLFLLGSDWLSYTIASFYLEVGLGAQWASFAPAASAAADTLDDAGFWWSLGLGIDIPLWDPDVGYAPWLSVLYRNHRGDFDVSEQEEIDLSLHALIVGLGWRINGLPF